MAAKKTSSKTPSKTKTAVESLKSKETKQAKNPANVKGGKRAY
jgi:hypothetical protein